MLNPSLWGKGAEERVSQVFCFIVSHNKKNSSSAFILGFLPPTSAPHPNLPHSSTGYLLRGHPLLPGCTASLPSTLSCPLAGSKYPVLLIHSLPVLSLTSCWPPQRPLGMFHCFGPTTLNGSLLLCCEHFWILNRLSDLWPLAHRSCLVD